MQYFISCQQQHLAAFDGEATVADVKALVSAREGVPAEMQYVTVGGRVLEEGTLASQGVTPLATVNVGVRMVGGTFAHSFISLVGFPTSLTRPACVMCETA